MQSHTPSNEKTSPQEQVAKAAHISTSADSLNKATGAATDVRPGARAPFVPYLPDETTYEPVDEAALDRHATGYTRVSLRELVLAVLFLGGVNILFLSPAIFSGSYLSPADLLIQSHPWIAKPPEGWGGVTNLILSDSVTQFEPWRVYAAQRLQAGSLPLWNPDNMLGAPFIGNAQTGVFNPLNWLFYLWSSPESLVVRAWLKLLLAAMGMYLLARQVLRVRPLGAIIAAVSYALGATMTVWLMLSVADAALWLPWVWWATGRLMSQPSPGRLAALAVVVALSLFSGHMETAFHLALVTGPFAVFEAFRSGSFTARRIAGSLAMWGAGYALGAGIAAIQILPFLEYLDHSTIKLVRSNSASPESVPWFYAWTLFSPKLFGSPVAPSTWWGPLSNYNESNTYCGVLTLLLAPFAVLAGGMRRRPLALFLLAIIVFSMGVVYHWPVIYDLASRIPLLGATRGQRMVFVVQFAFALLAALGAEGIWQHARRRRWRVFVCLAVAMVLLLLAGVVVPWLNASNPFPVPPDHAGVLQTWREGLTRGGLLVLVYGAVILAATALWRTRPRETRGVLVLLPLILVFDLISAISGHNPTIPPSRYFPTTPEIEYLQNAPKPARYIAKSWIIPANTNLIYGLSDFRGYDVMMPFSYRELGQQIDSEVNVPEPRALNNVHSPIINYLDVRYVLIPPDDPLGSTIIDVEQPDFLVGEPGVVGPITGDAQPGQTFVATRNNLMRVRVFGATYARQNVGQLVFHLKDSPDAPQDLATVQVDTSQLKDNAYWDFDFPPIPDSMGRTFYFYLESPDAPELQAVTAHFSPDDAYAAGSRMMNGQPAEGDLTFSTVSLLSPDDPWLRPVQGVGGGGDGGDGGEGERIVVLENRRALSRAWLVHGVEVIEDRQARLDRLKDPDFDPGRAVVLNQALDSNMPLPTEPPAGGDTVSLDSYEPENVQISTGSTAAGLLVLADQDFPGWRAYVDDQPATIHTANHALRAVYVPAGNHKVRFEYQPAAFQLGLSITLGSLLVTLLLPLVGALLRRTRGAARAQKLDPVVPGRSTGKN
ncbi:MAG: YfhO family protein [Chloroflexota bacterium]|nr:YfhO family protein [Chloroflexota bacterium]MDQ5865026.1 YfhO family protein [Chloroflexota bacterium]